MDLNSRERMLAVLNLEEPDKVPIQDSVWNETLARWKTEGFPKNASVEGYFGFELSMISCDLTPRYEDLSCAESDRWVLSCTS